MSCCTTPTKCLDLLLCTDTIEIGSLTSGLANIDVTIYFKVVATGRIQAYPATSGVGGVISFDPIETLMQDHTYQLWVTIRDENYKEYEPISVVDALGVVQTNLTIVETTFRKGELANQSLIVCA